MEPSGDPGNQRKRKHSKDKEKNDKKIRKMEKKLARYRKMADQLNASPDPVNNQELYRESPEDTDPILEDKEVLTETEQVSENDEIVSIEDEEDTVHISTNTEQELPSDILMALGESACSEKGYGEEIHSDILKRMENILLEGLTKEQKDKSLQECLIPSNGKLLDAPKLNFELTGVMNLQAKTRDKLLEVRQQDIGLATATILQVINSLSTSRPYDKIKIIKVLSESSRLLCNLHFQYTTIRRKLIAPFIDKQLSNTLKENRRGEFLFTKLEESVKTLRAGYLLKPKQQLQNSTKNYQTPRRPNQNQAPPGRAAIRGGHQPQQRYQARPLRLQGRRQLPSTGRGRARYP